MSEQAPPFSCDDSSLLPGRSGPMFCVQKYIPLVQASHRPVNKPGTVRRDMEKPTDTVTEAAARFGPPGIAAKAMPRRANIARPRVEVTACQTVALSFAALLIDIALRIPI